MTNNILVCSAGRRVELVKAFRSSLEQYRPEGKVFCTDMHPELSSACHVADAFFKAPRVTDAGYIEFLLSVCIENSVGLVVPTIDTELLTLAQNRERFQEQGITILVSDVDLIKLCRDKRKTAKLFTLLNIEQPTIFDKDDLTFPCFCKPYDGSCSVGAVAIQNRSELTDDLLSNPKNMFMELIPKSYSEYTVDAYYSRDNTLKCLVPRKRLEVRGGEVSKGVTRKNFVYDYLLKRANTLTGARGCITFQLFVNEETKSIKGLEINPRFGGGYPLSNDAGARFTDWLVKEYLCDDNINFFDSWEDDLIMLRYDAKVLVRGNK
ncbi:ATP-grasp domain-containing protein [Vibrio parahaemolyticus]|uniref:ATP-grasp domain-containing protein n=7 Tax=Vibrio parahaemolyticus TaxID=670 RepID=A0A4Z2SMH1_VIBPH|nr:ATP-grasp domain-containing protein [Vibrio parahaemolyticus]EFO37245.1 pilin glycosylation protein PglB2 [Vibrio parahaemolyticus Peru-466]EFO46348.1 pilin glycosylation protein PglB2 [Vibrio parahaemolyticus AQ4037]EFO48885.1 pilin glycosylation protein PglB2 [Vibrio parahaemolyticus K5030]EVU10944.1 ATP-grasp domain protein [Vibrio parahaemolyticus V-223/04]ARC18441.1 carbamoyl phosphate synthase large subunit [Vibrio parahaemolyticus]